MSDSNDLLYELIISLIVEFVLHELSVRERGGLIDVSDDAAIIVSSLNAV